MIRTMLAAACLLAVSVNAWAQVPAQAKKTADILTGDAKGSAANNPQCKLFTIADAARFVGEPVEAPKNAAGGSGCQWEAKDGTGDMMVQVVPASYHTPPKLSKGYKALPADLGEKAYVAPQFDGWVAGVLRGADSIVVSLAGNGANEASTVELLKETLKRRTPGK
jgi:hypothetical protein